MSATAVWVPPASAATAEQTAITGQTFWRGDQTAANKALVTYFYEQLFNQGNLSVIDAYVAPTYIQHNPFAPDGPEALRALITRQKQNNPQQHNTVSQVIADGDLVLVHSTSRPTPDALGTDVVDVFRVSKGKLVEHWDTFQPVSATPTKPFHKDPHAIVSKPMVVAQGELVAVRYHYQKNRADLGQAVVEIYRVRHGRIVQRWTVVQNVPPTSANSNTMF
nr:nuclear transport factor 2 family protein [Streptomyces sp. SID13031]